MRERKLREKTGTELDSLDNIPCPPRTLQIIGPPRSFTSNNRGWYAGGKIQVPVGGKMVWAQIGVNLTIMGSKDWKAK